MDKKTARPGPSGRRQQRGTGGDDMARKKPLPPVKTHAEEFYYAKQMNAQTPMIVVMSDGEQIHGRVEWYDEHCIKVHRDEGPNLLIYKRYIRCLFKDEEAEAADET